MKLATYHCHKCVQAARITALDPVLRRITVDLRPGTTVEWAVPPEYFTKHSPVVGGYFVLYEDGYQSFSPAATFEAGYTEEEAAVRQANECNAIPRQSSVSGILFDGWVDPGDLFPIFVAAKLGRLPT